MKNEKKILFNFNFLNLSIGAIFFSLITLLFFNGIDFIKGYYSHTSFYYESLVYLILSVVMAILFWFIYKLTKKKLFFIELLMSTSLTAVAFIIVIILIPIIVLLTFGYFISMSFLLIGSMIESLIRQILD